MIKNITVYCASSSKLPIVYHEGAKNLGQLLAKNNIGLVYGAGSSGLMGEIADAVLEAGGKVIGVIPQFMCDVEWQHKGCTELIITDTMHERKAKMAELGDAAVALPGGFGTMEELLEIITWKQLGIYEKPIGILNTNSFYDSLIAQFQKASESLFVRPEHLNIWSVAERAEDIIPKLEQQKEIREDIRNFAKI